MGGLRGNPHLWRAWVVAVLGTCSGGWVWVVTGGHGHRCHRCHTEATQVSRTHLTHTFITHRVSEQCEWEGPSGDDPAQPLARQGHLEQVTLVQVDWDVSREGDPAPPQAAIPGLGPSMMEGSSASC